mgnify:CR=1 FL=1
MLKGCYSNFEANIFSKFKSCYILTFEHFNSKLESQPLMSVTSGTSTIKRESCVPGILQLVVIAQHLVLRQCKPSPHWPLLCLSVHPGHVS